MANINPIINNSSWQKLLNELVEKGVKKAQLELKKNPKLRVIIEKGIKRAEGMAEANFDKDFAMFQTLQRFALQAKQQLQKIVGESDQKITDLLKIKKIVDYKRKVEKHQQQPNNIEEQTELEKNKEEIFNPIKNKEEQSKASEKQINEENIINENDQKLEDYMQKMMRLRKENNELYEKLIKQKIDENERIKKQEMEEIQAALRGVQQNNTTPNNK